MRNCIGLAELRPAIFAAATALSGLLTGAAFAQSEIIDPAFSTCGTVNCSATEIAGWAGSSAGQVLPWTGKFLIEAGNCLRLEVSSITISSANLEMVVVAPNGTKVYRNDQGGGACTNCPLVKIDPAPASGFYTAVISSSTGAVVDSDFHLLFGQYQHTNANCTPATGAIP